MRKIVYLFIIPFILSCNSNGISDSLIEVNESQIIEVAYFIQIRYYLDPNKVLKTYTKSENLMDYYYLLKQNIENGKADKTKVHNYLNELISLGILENKIYNEKDFNYKDLEILKYQIQNVTLRAFQNIKSEFYKNYYSSYQTSFSVNRQDNNIELIPFIQDTMSGYKIILGKLTPNTNEFSNSFLQLDSLNKISLQELKGIGLQEYIEGLLIFRKFDGYLDTLRIKEKIHKNGC